MFCFSVYFLKSDKLSKLKDPTGQSPDHAIKWLKLDKPNKLKNQTNQIR